MRWCIECGKMADTYADRDCERCAECDARSHPGGLRGALAVAQYRHSVAVSCRRDAETRLDAANEYVAAALREIDTIQAAIKAEAAAEETFQ